MASSPLSPRQQRILEFAATRLHGNVAATDWMAVPQPNAPDSERQMRDSLERLLARGLLIRRPRGRYRLPLNAAAPTYADAISKTATGL